MKRCVSCGKEIVDAAVNCLFCGSKQTPDAALKKTVMGFGTADMWKDKPPPLAAPLATPPPMTPAPRTPPPMARTPTPRPMPTPAPVSTPRPVTPAPAGTPAPRRAATEPPVHQLHPFEPWAGSLRAVMIVFGLLLAATTAAPRQLDPLVFIWDALGGEQGPRLREIVPLAFGAGGFLALLLGVFPLLPVVRGVVAVLVGIGLLVARELFVADAFTWRSLVWDAGTLLAAAGLLVRASYPASLAGRLLATAGALAILAQSLVPQGSIILPVEAAKHVTDGVTPAIHGALLLGDVVLALLTLILVWLPSGRGGGAALAWALVVIVPAGAIAMALAAGAHPALQTIALLATGAYGLATLVGKGCERPAS
jgi:hypothetical protein